MVPLLPTSPLNMSVLYSNNDGGFIISRPVAETNNPTVHRPPPSEKKKKSVSACAKKQISRSILQSLCGLIFSLCFALANTAHPLQNWQLGFAHIRQCCGEKLLWDLRGIEGPQMGVCQCSESQTSFSAFLPGLFVKTGGSFALLGSHWHF